MVVMNNVLYHHIPKPPFSSVHTQTSSQVLKNLHSGERFCKDAFSVTFSPNTCGHRRPNRRKNLHSFWPIEIRILRYKKGHFRVPKNLAFKARLSAKPLIRKWFLIMMQIKLIFKGFALSLVLGVRFFGTRKWPIWFFVPLRTKAI